MPSGGSAEETGLVDEYGCEDSVPSESKAVGPYCSISPHSGSIICSNKVFTTDDIDRASAHIWVDVNGCRDGVFGSAGHIVPGIGAIHGSVGPGLSGLSSIGLILAGLGMFLFWAHSDSADGAL